MTTANLSTPTGATMMPTMSAALGTLKRDEVARATSGLNVLLRAGGSVETALAVVVLTSQLSNVVRSAGNVPFDLAAARSLPAATRAAMLPALGGAFPEYFPWLVRDRSPDFHLGHFPAKKAHSRGCAMTPATEEGQLA